jgi:beta-hydroxylase
MDSQILAPKYVVLGIFLASVLYVHFRGRVRHNFLRQLVDHSAFLAPYNVLMYFFSAVPTKPILDSRDFVALQPLRDNWRVIREDALRLFDEGYIRAAAKNNDVNFNSFFKRGWKRFYVKWYGDRMPSAQALCPRTVALVESIPSINAAMFALLSPGARLNPHRDPFAGSLRYHLGLVTPDSGICRIFIDGEPYSWRDGEDIVFDETYIHSAENRSDQTRIILFCDIERPLKSALLSAVNRVFKRFIGWATATQNLEGEDVGAINMTYGFFHQLGVLRRRFKNANRTLYRLTKYALVAGAIVALILI